MYKLTKIIAGSFEAIIRLGVSIRTKFHFILLGTLLLILTVTQASSQAYITEISGSNIGIDQYRVYVPNSLTGPIYLPSRNNLPTNGAIVGLKIRANESGKYYLNIADEPTLPWNSFFSTSSNNKSNIISLGSMSYFTFNMQVLNPTYSDKPSKYLHLELKENDLLFDDLVETKFIQQITDADAPVFAIFSGGAYIGIYDSNNNEIPMGDLSDETSFIVYTYPIDNLNNTGNESGIWKVELEYADNVGFVTTNAAAWQQLSPFPNIGPEFNYSFTGVRGHTYFFRVRAYDNVGNMTTQRERGIFIRETNLVSTSSVPSNGGTTSGNGTYFYGDKVIVTATPKNCYSFNYWTNDNGSVVSTNATYSFYVYENTNLFAHFSPIYYSINLSSNPTGGGTTGGSGTYLCGTSRSVTATPTSGYSFSNWTESGSVVSSNATYTFTLTSNSNLVANFTQNPVNYTITTSSNPSGGGTTNGSGTFQSGTSRSVTATPTSGYSFSNWTESGSVVSSNATYTFTLTSNRNLVANFTQNPVNYTITTSSNPSGGGTTNGSGTFQSGTSRSVTATPTSGYSFSNWTESGSVVSSNATYTFTLTSNRNLVANFTQNPVNYTITTSSNPSGGGTTNGSGTFQSGTSRSVTATPTSGYSFSNWTESGSVVSSNATYTFTLTSNRNLVANFTQNPVNYTITTSSNPSGGGTTNGSGTFQSGTSRSVTATPTSGYSFSNWTESGSVVSSNATYTFTLTSNRNLVANFTQNPVNYTITTSSNPSGGGTTNGSGTFQSGTSRSVTATPTSGYSFSNWTESGSVVSSNATYTFTLTSNRNLVANFTQGSNPLCNNFLLTKGQYAETENLNTRIQSEFGENYSIADWADLKAISNINDWISCIGLSEDQTFLLTKNGANFYNVNRHYYVHYSSDGIPYSGFSIHDQIGGLYLGSWYGITMNVLAKKNISSIAETESLNIKVYPNPANHEVVLESDLILNHVQVLNLLGSVLLEKTIKSQKVRIDLSQLSTGNYLMKISTAKGIISKNLVVFR